MAVIRHELQEYATVLNLVSSSIPPKTQDKVYIAETNKLYDYSPSSVATPDGWNVIQQTGFTGRWVAIQNIASVWDIIDDLAVSEEVSNNTTTFANITGLGQTLQAGGVYEMKAIVVYNTAVATTGIQLSYGGVAAPSIYACFINIPETTTGLAIRHFAAPNTETAASSASRTTNNYADMTLIFGCATTGLYYPRFASEIAGSAVTIKRGTNLKIRRLS